MFFTATVNSKILKSNVDDGTSVSKNILRIQRDKFKASFIKDVAKHNIIKSRVFLELVLKEFQYYQNVNTL